MEYAVKKDKKEGRISGEWIVRRVRIKRRKNTSLRSINGGKTGLTLGKEDRERRKMLSGRMKKRRE